MLEFIDEEESVFINVIDGDEFCLIIVVIGKLVFVVDWYKDDKKIRKISWVKIDAKGDKFLLVILNVIFDDFGSYKCEVFSKLGIVFCIFDVCVVGM